MNFEEFNQKAEKAVRDIHKAFDEFLVAMRPAIQDINKWVSFIMLGSHKDEPIANYFKRMERQEKARKRYLRQIARRAK